MKIASTKISIRKPSHEVRGIAINKFHEEPRPKVPLYIILTLHYVVDHKLSQTIFFINGDRPKSDVSGRPSG